MINLIYINHKLISLIKFRYICKKGSHDSERERESFIYFINLTFYEWKYTQKDDYRVFVTYEHYGDIY